jgi:hypothetical protein
MIENQNPKIRNVIFINAKRMKIRRMGKKIAFKKKLITNLGTILASFQQGLAKTNPYAYHPVLTFEKNK